MILVIDANPFIAGFLRNSTSRQIILSEKPILYSPDWLIDEFERNEPEFIEKYSNSGVFFETKYSNFMEEASKLTKHTKDAPYFALALSLKCPVWSDEKSFKQQSRVEIYSTSDLVKKLEL